MHQSVRLAGATVVTALVVLAAAACAATPMGLANPAPNAAAPTSVGPNSSPTPESTQTVRPTDTSTLPKTGPPDCLGAVIYTIDAAVAGPVRPPRCVSVGALLRVTSHGPGGFSSAPLNRVACDYEGGVHECRLIRTGSATFTITRAGQLQSFELLISAAASPPRPGAACQGVQTITINPSLEGPPWAARCVKKGSVLRVESFGPDGFSVSPWANVSCRYEAAVRECRLVKDGTVEFTMTSTTTRTLTVVVLA